MSYMQVKLLVLIVSYMVYDVTVILACMTEYSTPVKQSIFHHFLSAYGAIVGIFCGRFLGVVASATVLTEASTPFVNIRELLHFHKDTNTLLYSVNAIAMIVSFFVFRILISFFLIFYICVPGFIELDWTHDSLFAKCIISISTLLYMLLYILNIYWFYRIIKGALKYFSSAKSEQEEALLP